jgi:hypothetical protein
MVSNEMCELGWSIGYLMLIYQTAELIYLIFYMIFIMFEDWDKPRKIVDRIASVWTEIWTRDLPNTKQC